MELSRRHLLAGAATAATASALGIASPSPAGAAAPPTGKQAPGFYRMKIGEFEATVVTDGVRVRPLPANFVRNAPQADVDAAFRNAFVAPNTEVTAFTPIVINTGSKLVAIDTGLGPATYAQSKGMMGQYQTNLAASGIEVGSIDTVVISHFHGDHINGLLDAAGKPIFAKAEVMVPAAEWDFWMDDGNMSKAAGTPIEGNFKNARRVFGPLAERITRYQADKEVVPGITAVATPGHTPGHTSHLVSSGNAQLVVQADVTTAQELFIRNPGWHVFYDMDGKVAEQSRRKLYDRLATDRLMVHGYHNAFPSVGYVAKEGDGYRFVPARWHAVV